MERAEGGGWGLAEPGTSVRPATVQRGLARGRQTRAGSRRSATKTIGPDYATPAGSSDANSGSASKASSGSGGARAGAGLGGSWGRPRWERMRRLTSVSVMTARTRVGPPQAGQTVTSRSNTRAKS